MARANGIGALDLLNRVIFLGVVSLLLFGATGCNERLKRMESNQVVLEEKIDYNARQASLISKKMEMSQALLKARIERVQEGNNVALAETRATRYEQEKLREETRAFGQKWYAGITRVEGHQRQLQDSANVIDEGVQKLDAGQATQRVAVAENHQANQDGFSKVVRTQNELREAASVAFGGLEEGQASIKAVASAGVTATADVAGQVKALQTSQDAQTGILREHHQVLVAKMDGVSSDQQRHQQLAGRQMRRLSEQVTTAQTDLRKANDEQSALISGRADSIERGLKTTQQNQKGLSGLIKGHHTYAQEVGRNIESIEAEQKNMNDAMRQGNRTVGMAVKAVGKNQKKLQTTLVNVESTAVATQKETEAIANKQSEFHVKQGQRHDIVVQAMADLESSQQTIQDTMTTQTGIIREQQSELNQGLAKEGTHIRQDLVQLKKNQGQLQRTANQVQVTANAIKEVTRENAIFTHNAQEQQNKFQGEIAQEGTRIREDLAQLEKNQGQLQESVTGVQATADQIKDRSSRNGQAIEGLRSGQVPIQNGVAQLGETQTQLQKSVNRVEVTANAVEGKTDKNAKSLRDMYDQQAPIHKGLSRLDRKQDQLQQNVGRVQTVVDAVQIQAESNGKTARGIQFQQERLQRNTASEGAETRQALNDVRKDQEQLNRSVNTMQVTSNTVISNTATLMEQQAASQRVLHQNQSELVDTLRQVTAKQTVLSQQGGALQQGQGEIKELLVDSKNAMGGKVDAVSQQQTHLNNAVAGVAATTQTLSNDTNNLKQGQAVIKAEVQRGPASMVQEVKQINASQSSLSQAMRDGKNELDSQLQAIQENQSKLGQAMAGNQQASQTQTKDIGKRADMLESSLGQVDKNISSLQTHLVAQITELTRVMQALQAQGGTQVSQLTGDMKTFNDTLRQIQATQAALAKRVEQVDASQKQRNKQFLSVLEKLQKETGHSPDDTSVEAEPKEVDVVK